METLQTHIVLFPYLAQGHISPFLSLAARLHHYQPSLTITLVSTPRHISSIRSILPPDSHLNLHALPFYPADHGLPDGAESPADIPVPQFIAFFKATESLYPSFDDFISSLVSNASDRTHLGIVSDFFFGWAVDVAHKHKVYHTTFLTMGAFGGAVFFSVWSNLPHTHTKSNQFSLPEYPEVVIDQSQLPMILLQIDGSDESFQFFIRQFTFFHKTNATIMNTVEEFEPLGLGMLRKNFNFPIQPIGPLVLANQPSSSKPELETEIMSFLGSQSLASVLYICFGSQNSIQPEQMMQLAQGLEGSGCTFIWVIRPPIGYDPKCEFRDEWLPYGFKERMKQKNSGLIVHGWVPQLKILNHGSTGAFLSHCGWNSILERMTCGVPIIGWPVSGEQPFNLMMLVESGLAIELARGMMNSSVPTKEKVEEMVRLAMGSSGKGMEIRRKAKECRDVMSKAWNEEDGSSMKNLLNLFKQSVQLL